MKMNDVKELAVQKGVRPARLKKEELIRAIQEAENNGACYMTNQVDICGQTTCLWRSDCR